MDEIRMNLELSFAQLAELVGKLEEKQEYSTVLSKKNRFLMTLRRKNQQISTSMPSSMD
jgi:hypothetical protein